MTAKVTREQLVGLYPALPTPTDANANVDCAATTKLVDFLCGSGVNGHALRPLQQPKPETMEKMRVAIAGLQGT